MLATLTSQVLLLPGMLLPASLPQEDGSGPILAKASLQGGGRALRDPALRKKDPPPAGKVLELPGAPARPGLYSVYSVRLSRRIFAACDLNGDDRLGYFEALKTLDGITKPKDFRRLDLDRDGVVTYDEFDRHFKELLKRGEQVTVLLPAMKRMKLAPKVPISLDPELVRFFSMLDTDGNHRIEPREWEKTASLVYRKPKTRFIELDKDFSGTLSLEELEPMAPELELGDRTKQRVKLLRPLPEGLQGADLDSNSLLSRAEVERALERIHPTLVRHSSLILKRVDLNGDQVLDALEVQEAMAGRSR